MNNLKWGLLLVVLVGGGGFAWLKQHDATVRWRAMAEQRQDALGKKDADIDAFRMSVESLSVAAARRDAAYNRTRKQMRDTVATLLAGIDELSASILNMESLPPEVGQAVRDIVKKCQAIESRVTTQLEACEERRREDSLLLFRKDSLIIGITDSRDDWKDEAQEALSKTGGRTRTWLTVVTNAASAVLGFLIGKKSGD